MSAPTIVCMPGDGIGPVVLEQARRVLDRVGFAAEFIHADIGWECWRRDGRALPARTLELLQEHRLGLFGAITSKPPQQAEAELDSSLRGTGLVYRSPILELRQTLALDLCVRPCRTYPGNPLNHVRRNLDGELEEPQIDVVVLRQNTEGLYTGVAWTDPPAAVRSALATHPHFRPFDDVEGEDLAVDLRLFTRGATRRLLRAGFEWARDHGRRSVTVCEKANVLRATGAMMVEEAESIAKEYQDIELRVVNIDAQMMWLGRDPEICEVVVASNMFGDILSDGFAGLVGGLGFAASVNLGENVAVFEPTHGSAPRYADLSTSIVNPIAMILAAALLLDRVGEATSARRVREAVAAVVREGRVRTYDMLRLKGGPDVIARGAASTVQMTDAVIERL